MTRDADHRTCGGGRGDRLGDAEPAGEDGSGRVPHVRTSVHGPKTFFFQMLSLPARGFLLLAAVFSPKHFAAATKGRVAHISLVFREMWDTTALKPANFVFSLGALILQPDFRPSGRRTRSSNKINPRGSTIR
jgi:hypothetical protein